jgi:hypothetical protein
LTLTAAGEAQLAKLTQHALAHDRQLDEMVGAEGKRALLGLLKELLEELESRRGAG